MRKKNNTLPLLLGAAAFGAYRFYKGCGIFNKIRFAEQHNAVSKYLEQKYPEAICSEITSTKDGWSCAVNSGREKIVLYMAKSPDGSFIFWERVL